MHVRVYAYVSTHIQDFLIPSDHSVDLAIAIGGSCELIEFAHNGHMVSLLDTHPCTCLIHTETFIYMHVAVDRVRSQRTYGSLALCNYIRGIRTYMQQQAN